MSPEFLHRACLASAFIWMMFNCASAGLLLVSWKKTRKLHSLVMVGCHALCATWGVTLAATSDPKMLMFNGVFLPIAAGFMGFLGTTMRWKDKSL